MVRLDLGPVEARAPANDRFPGGKFRNGASRFRRRGNSPAPSELAFLLRGLRQPGGKLPLFDEDGQAYPPSLIERCIAAGWAERWFRNPLKPDWLVCRLTAKGRMALEDDLGVLFSA